MIIFVYSALRKNQFASPVRPQPVTKAVPPGNRLNTGFLGQSYLRTESASGFLL